MTKFLKRKAGSPPQVRGKLRFFFFQFAQFRITPAGAGKTAIVADVSARRQDHPRRCGENACFLILPIVLLGSPPQVRGKRTHVFLAVNISRITPAGAGKTKKLQFAADGMEDHPRRCGENRTATASHFAETGSPPQVRGKRCNNNDDFSGSMDHPRRCGENIRAVHPHRRRGGSPPQVRGKQALQVCPR